MTFWIAAALLTFAAALCVVLPMAAVRKEFADPIEYDKAIYKARLSEIEKDLELGRTSPEAAAAAKAEEGRKLITLSENERTLFASESQQIWLRRIAVLAGMVGLPAASLAVYMAFGNPGMSDQRLADRLRENPSNQSIGELVSRAEAHLAQNPDDARGWSVLAPVYSRLGRNEDAVQAWSNVYRLAPETPEIRATLAESMMAVSEGVVTEQARKLFSEELAVNPSSAKARFYLAMALDQEGRYLESVDAWAELIRGGDPDAPWIAAAQNFYRQAAKEADVPANPSLASGDPVPGPSAEQVEAAGEMSRDERAAMIRSMVDGLAQRLADDPADKAGWLRLIRAYTVLGESDEALEAIRQAGNAHAEDKDFAAELEKIRKSIEQGSKQG